MPFEYQKPDNLVSLFEQAVHQYANLPLFGTKGERGEYNWITYAQVGERVDALRAAFLDMGIQQGDKIGFIGNNSVEWAVSAFAAYGCGAVFVPMYEQEKASTWKYIIEHSECKVLIVFKAEIAAQVSDFLPNPQFLQRVIVVQATGENALQYFIQHRKTPAQQAKTIRAHDTAALIYTSGTTGKPKGVLLSHGNFTHDARAGYLFYTNYLKSHTVSLSILPWAHAYGQVAELYNWLQFGGSIGFMEKIETLADDLLQVKPTIILAVPRVFNKVHSGIYRKMKEAGGLTEKLFTWAVATAAKRRKLKQLGKNSVWLNLQHALGDKLVLSKIRARFGGRLEGALTASAMMNDNISRFFWDIGIPVADAYGLTETSPALAMNRFENFRPGSVGKALNGIRLVIDKNVGNANPEEGEIIAYGPVIMQGYYKDEKATQAIMTHDGGLRTGDIGRLDADGFLFITGRIKEQYKLENGKYVYPTNIEEAIKQLPYMENAMVYGANRGYNIALLSFDLSTLKQWAHNALLKTDINIAIHKKEIQEFIEQEVTVYLRKSFGGYEIPKKFIFIDDTFSIENGMLTQTMKVKRKEVLRRYIQQIEACYQD